MNSTRKKRVYMEQLVSLAQGFQTQVAASWASFMVLSEVLTFR